MSTEITINQDIVEINVTEEVVVIEAPSGAYPLPSMVSSVFGRTGNVVAQEGDYTLTQLGDVTITSPTNNQVLKYNGTQWVNGTDTDTGLTSVGLSMPSAFSVANSPLTANGTLSVTGAGTTAQYVRGDGSLATFPTIAQEAQRLITEVYNSTGATLTKGTVVYINGGQGNLPTVTKAIATGDATSAQTYGVVQSDITNMNNGFVVAMGSLTDLDTQIYPVGTQLYLSGTTAGAWTSTKPYAPIHLVYVGIVVRSHPTQGVVEIRIQNGYELDELHDVSAQNPTNGDILQYVAATDLWTKVAGTTTNIAEGTNLYYTDARSRAAFSESVTGLDYNSTTGVLSTTSGFGIPTTASQSTWNTAYNRSLTSAAVTGTTTKTLTLNQQDGGTITASWTDINTDAVTSVFGRTGAVTAQSGDYTTTQVTEGTNLYFTDARARAAITLTTTGTSGAATYSGGTLNIPQYQGVLTNPVTGTGTTNTLPKFTGASTIGNSNITDSGSLITLGSNTRLNGSLWLNTTQTNMGLANYVNMTGSTSVYGQMNAGIIQSDATVNGFYYDTFAQTAAASFTLGNLVYYRAYQGTFGAGSTVTLQTGFEVNSTLIGATTNYGFRGRIASGTNRWNLFMDGTANNYLAGSLGIGTTSFVFGGGTYNLNLTKNITGTVVAGAMNIGSIVQSDVTSAAIGLNVQVTTAAAAFTLNQLRHISVNQTTLGAGSSVTNQYGIYVDQITNGSSNFGFFGNVPAGTNRWNIYMAGTANNFLAGSLGIGSTSVGSSSLLVAKTIAGGATRYGIWQAGQVQSDVTTLAVGIYNQLNTQATAFTLGSYAHLLLQQGTIGASSAISNQFGIFIDSTMTGATNNYGIYGAIAAGTNRWNLYMAGTAANYMAGALLIGTTTISAFSANSLLDVNGDARVSNSIYYKLFGTSANYYRVGILAGTANFEIFNTNIGRTDLLITQSTGVATFSNTVYSNGSFKSYIAAQTALRTYAKEAVVEISSYQSIGGSPYTKTTDIVANADSTVASQMRLLTTTGAGTPTTALFINSIGSINIGTTSSDASARLQVDSTTQGFLPPRMTTTQKLAIGTPAAGLMVYDTTLNQMSYYNGTLWINF
jgi:hypothetical protein